MLQNAMLASYKGILCLIAHGDRCQNSYAGSCAVV